jgi:type II secretion system protein H
MTRTRGNLQGFTLIEMLVVIALAALMATVVIVSLAGSYRAARTEDVAGQVAMYDRLAREHARRFGLAGKLVFDLGRGTVTRAAAVEAGDGRASAGAPLHLPAAVRLTRIMTAGGAASGGEVSIACSRSGQTPSYAICLTGAKAEEYWIVTAGLTGKTLRVRDEREARDIFAAIAGNAAGDDAR